MLPAFDYQDDSKFENQVLKAFKEQYPDIELELITASIDNWMVKLRTSASSGEAIDVFQDSANNNPMYALRGINQPLQDYIDMNNPESAQGNHGHRLLLQRQLLRRCDRAGSLCPVL